MGVLKMLWIDEEGSDATEYALLGSLIVMAIIAAMAVFAGSVNNLFGFVSTTVSAAIAAS